MTSATDKARARWGSQRQHRSKQRLRQDTLDTLDALARLDDPTYRDSLDRALGQDEVDTIIRAGKAMAQSLR